MATIVYLCYANDQKGPTLKYLKEEKRKVLKALTHWDTSGGIKLIQEENAGLDDVLDRLREKEFSRNLIIFGFSGHAGNGKLMFSEEEALGAGLAKLLSKEYCPYLKLVVLNGCVTKEHLRFFEDARVPVIITTNARVEDKRAMEFSSSLFSRLSQGDTLYEAYGFAFREVITRSQADKKENVRCYRSIQFKEPPRAEPVWEFAFLEEHFKHWKLELGIRDPEDRGTFHLEVLDLLQKTIQIFSRSYIEPDDCDASVDYLEDMQREIEKTAHSSLLNTLSIQHKLERQITEIHHYRNVCMSGTPEAEQQQKRIQKALISMYSDFKHI